MASEALQRAIESLEIQDVYVRDLVATCVGEFDPKYSGELDRLEVQQMHLVRQASVASLCDEHRLLRVFLRLGARWVDPDKQDEEPAVRAVIEAEFVAEYRMEQELDQEAIDAFALRNASYHVWPYWRELLSNQCTRMHLPKLMLPMAQVAANRDHAEADADG